MLYAATVKAFFVTAAAMGALSAHALSPSPAVVCKTDIRIRSGSREETGRCRAARGKAQGSWACYQDVIERCTTGAGGLTQREFRHWTGACAASVEDCTVANGHDLDSTLPILPPGPRRITETTALAVTLASAADAGNAWLCDDVEVEKSSQLDIEHGICGRNGVTRTATPWACYALVDRRCRERYSGATKSTREKRFLGCFVSFSECR